jgi:hypothetical protein
MVRTPQKYLSSPPPPHQFFFRYWWICYSIDEKPYTEIRIVLSWKSQKRLKQSSWWWRGGRLEKGVAGSRRRQDSSVRGPKGQGGGARGGGKVDRGGIGSVMSRPREGGWGRGGIWNGREWGTLSQMEFKMRKKAAKAIGCWCYTSELWPNFIHYFSEQNINEVFDL